MGETFYRTTCPVYFLKTTAILLGYFEAALVKRASYMKRATNVGTLPVIRI